MGNQPHKKRDLPQVPNVSAKNGFEIRKTIRFKGGMAKFLNEEMTQKSSDLSKVVKEIINEKMNAKKNKKKS